MKFLRFFTSGGLALALIIALNTRISPAPPLGKFLDPVNGFWANAKDVDVFENSTIQMAGIQAPTSIIYDDNLIPHIFAQNDEDLYFAQGYTHAEHRLWQMEFQNLYAAGRVSEVVGDLAANYDRGQRRRGMLFGAQNFLKSIENDPESLKSVESYTAGINAYIRTLDYRSLPFEYKLLDYEPEPWTNFKCAVLLKYMSNMLNTGERDFENTNFLEAYGRDYLDLLYPDIDNYKDPVVENLGDWGFDPIDSLNSEELTLVSGNIDLLPKPNPSNGSNNWAVSSNKSANGLALLANDMHLSMYLPSLWFYNQLNAPGVNVFGHSLMGVPFVITGFNDSISWGFTNAQRDLVDWYKIQFKDETMDEYMLDGEWIPTTKIVEEVKVRGAETIQDTVVYTIFGPVVYDKNYRSDAAEYGYAYRWISHDASDEFKMFYEVNRAKNLDEFKKASDHHSAPAQNMVYADVKGNVAHKVQGKYPLKGFEEGKFLRDGTKSRNMWSQYIPTDHNAFWVNPERGFVASANQHPADSTYPYYVHARSYEAYRNRRINAVLEGDSSVSVEDFKDLHYDSYSLKAAESLPTILDYLDSIGGDWSEEEGSILGELRNWDYDFSADSKAAMYYDLIWDNLYRDIWDEQMNSEKDLPFPTNYSTIRLLINQPELSFFNVEETEETETAPSAVLYSFKKSVKEIIEWESQNEGAWAEYKGTFVRHFLQEPLGSYGIIASGNGGDVVNASGTNHGPSQRIIVEMDPNGVKAWGHYPGGQSGNPASQFYDNMVNAWANRRYLSLVLMDSPTQEIPTLYSQQLTPSNQE